MRPKESDQQKLSERALQKKRTQKGGTAPDRPAPGNTPGEGMNPVEREEPLEPDEKVQD